MNNSKFCINATNLHVGGGVQVAVSFIQELSCLDNLPTNLSILVSKEVHENLLMLHCDLNRFTSYEVCNTFGITVLWSGLASKLKNFDVVFTVFGPLYLFLLNKVSIVGFAQSWIIYPNNEIFKSLPLINKITTRLKFFLYSIFFKRSNQLIVELDHVKKQLVARGFMDDGKIHVVYNAINSIYLDNLRWKPLSHDIQKQQFAIGFVGRDYLHKNTNILPFIKKLLLDKHSVMVDFYVTFNPSEWKAKSDSFRQSIQNVGVLDVSQCPSFYSLMDAVIFPSLLECFSATPLEAMVMKKPLFASDRGFVRDICGDFAYYFNPHDPQSAADSIAHYIHNVYGRDDARLSAAHDHVINFSNPRRRAEEYLAIMQSAV